MSKDNIFTKNPKQTSALMASLDKHTDKDVEVGEYVFKLFNKTVAQIEKRMG